MFVHAAANLVQLNGTPMPDFNTLIPKDPLVFQVAWESTLKCNLDCSYCGDGHDNKSSHPLLSNCLDTVDFIFKYLDIKMKQRPLHMQQSNLNVQGGESLFHPKIIDILRYINKKKADVDWHLGTATITNAVVGANLWKRLAQYLDYYTISYHPESTTKQQQLVKDNILFLKSINKTFHVSIMMHPKHWDNCVSMVDWCKENNIECNARQIDHHWLDMRFNYNKEQTTYLTGKEITAKDKLMYALSKGLNLSSTGRACCGGNTLCAGGCETNYVQDNKFKGWHCSVADYFLYIRQTTGEVFTNKDCRMNYDGNVGPIGNLKDPKTIFSKMHNNGVVCKKSSCWCGLCAPKAATKELFINATKEDLNHSIE